MRLGLMERRIEAGDLRDMRSFRHDCLDRRKVVRLVERRERIQGRQGREHVPRN
ncbi:hypothetical protein D3C83_141430 [compost metagenome]